jgi:UDPglucose--hexose-1-phosphate uridylyltransferase
VTELRQDPATGEWVVIAPDRGRRPHDGVGATACPFCPGGPGPQTPEVFRLGTADGWRVRVVENLYPLLSGGLGPVADSDPVHRHARALPGRGRHEVVIDNPDHGWDLARGSVTEVRDVLEAYRARYRALTDEGAASITIFRNHGPRAGTSLSHPHSQVVAAPIVSPLTRRRLDRARRLYARQGRCPYLDLLDAETADGRRVVWHDDRVVAIVPYAAAAPYELWLLPREHHSVFGRAADATLDGLAEACRGVLAALAAELGDPDYNLIVHSAPPAEAEEEYFLWHLQVMPRLTVPAGFELGSGIAVNPSRPEESAGNIRRRVAAQPGGAEASPPGAVG